jgi:hypothetical protein
MYIIGDFLGEEFFRDEADRQEMLGVSEPFAPSLCGGCGWQAAVSSHPYGL